MNGETSTCDSGKRVVRFGSNYAEIKKLRRGKAKKMFQEQKAFGCGYTKRIILSFVLKS